MRHTLLSKKLGIGLAAPQVGRNLALAVICVRPLPHRLEIESFDLVIINPVIEQGLARKQSLWEGCISAGICALVPRYKKVRVKYYDEQAKLHNKEYKGLQAQVIQHEIDHLNGILFVDRVKDTKTYMTFTEYKKRIVKKKDARSEKL